MDPARPSWTAAAKSDLVLVPPAAGLGLVATWGESAASGALESAVTELYLAGSVRPDATELATRR